MSEPKKLYILLRHLPYYNKCEINEKRFWMDVIGISEDKQFEELIKKGWFK